MPVAFYDNIEFMGIPYRRIKTLYQPTGIFYIRRIFHRQYDPKRFFILE